MALTCPAYAGDIQNESPAPPANSAQEPTGGEIPNGYMPNGIMGNDEPDSLTQLALSVLALLL
jgi:hypothetical protein